MATTTNYLALDLGAESGRGLLGRFDGSRLALEEIHRFPNSPVKLLDTLYWNLPGLFDEIIDSEVASHPRRHRHRRWYINRPIRFREVVPDVVAFFQNSGACFILRTGDTHKNLVSERPDLHREIALPVFVEDLHFDGSDAGLAAKETGYPFHGLARLLIVGSMRRLRQVQQRQT